MRRDWTAIIVGCGVAIFAIVAIGAELFWTVYYESQAEGNGLVIEDHSLVSAAVDRTLWVAGAVVVATRVALIRLAKRRADERQRRERSWRGYVS